MKLTAAELEKLAQARASFHKEIDDAVAANDVARLTKLAHFLVDRFCDSALKWQAQMSERPFARWFT